MSFIVSLTGLSLLQGPELFMFTYLVICKHNAIVVVQSPSHVWLFATPWTTAHQASLPLTISWSLPKFMSIQLVMPSNCLILYCPLLLLPSVFSSIRVFSNESALCSRWPKFWSFCFSISLSNEYSWLISFRIHWFDLLVVQGIITKNKRTVIV